MSNSVTISVPARLHLGFLDPSGSAGRRFGSLGLAAQRARDRGEAVAFGRNHRRRAGKRTRRSASGDAVQASRHSRPAPAGHRTGDSASCRSRFRHADRARRRGRAAHAAHLPLDVDGDATLLARGSRSGIGIASFKDGGVIVDAGTDGSGRPPPVVARLPFPDQWRDHPDARPRQGRASRRRRDRGVPFASALPRQRRRRNLPACADGRHAGADRARSSCLRRRHHGDPDARRRRISRRRKAASSPRSVSRPWSIGWPRPAPSASARVPGVRRALPSRRPKMRRARWLRPHEATAEEGHRPQDRAGQELRREDQSGRAGPRRQLRFRQGITQSRERKKWPASTSCTC